jgi:DNA-binding CsgD family transcriptional regulator
VILANRAARQLSEADDGIVLSSEGVKLLHPSDAHRLQRLLAAAFGAMQSAKATPGGTMLALRPSGKRPFIILVSPLSSEPFALTSLRPAVCVVIADPDRQEALPTERLQALYGLTAAEAKLAMRLAMGDELKSAAERLGISYSTARTHLAAIFRKTETRRQGDLIKVLLVTLPLLAR